MRPRNATFSMPAYQLSGKRGQARDDTTPPTLSIRSSVDFKASTSLRKSNHSDATTLNRGNQVSERTTVSGELTVSTKQAWWALSLFSSSPTSTTQRRSQPPIRNEPSPPLGAMVNPLPEG